MAFLPLKIKTQQRLTVATQTAGEYETVLGPVLDLAGAAVDFTTWASFRLSAYVIGATPNGNQTAVDMTAVTGDASGNLIVKNSALLTAYNAGNFADGPYGQFGFEIEGVKVIGDAPQTLMTGTLTSAAIATA